MLRTRTTRTRAEDGTSPIKRISLELSRVCNLRCVYCYSRASPEHSDGLSDEEVRRVILEAVEAGARLISIVGGGETLLRKTILQDGASCVDVANDLGCYCMVYTNCTLVNDRAARWLHGRDVAVVGKLNSLRAEVQDKLVGVTGAAKRIYDGIEALLRAGFGEAEPPRLALETVICRANYDELPDMWRWMRLRGIVPEVEIPTMHGRAVDHRNDLGFSRQEAPAKYRALFEELLRIDRSEFGFDWTPHPPFPAGACQLYESNCYINERGGVQPCAGVEEEYGILRVGARADLGQTLASIVDGAGFRTLRAIRSHLQGACARCALKGECYGCRAAAWHDSGNVLGEDPVCWHGAGESDQPERRSLPVLPWSTCLPDGQEVPGMETR